MRRNGRDPTSRTSRPVLQVLRNNVSILFLVVSMGGMLAVFRYFNPDSANPPAEPTSAFSASTLVEVQTKSTGTAIIASGESPTAEPPILEPAVERIGIIAGHRGYDSGTVCSDGLTEVEVTGSIAETVASMLRESGEEVETLNEFDQRLDGYEAKVLVSIHIDSCDYINDLASGFKISGSGFTDSTELSICVQEAYSQATGLSYHPNSITPEMAGYHVFRKIGSTTPAIIIEMGFLNLDREVLTERSDDVAQGLHDGIMCFLDGQS